jgi:hypothetical protein
MDEEKGWLRKSKIHGVSLIKIHYIHVVKSQWKLFVPLIYANKNCKELTFTPNKILPK